MAAPLLPQGEPATWSLIEWAVTGLATMTAAVIAWATRIHVALNRHGLEIAGVVRRHDGELREIKERHAAEISDIKRQMDRVATKDDLASLRDNVAATREGVAEVNRRLDNFFLPRGAPRRQIVAGPDL